MILNNKNLTGGVFSAQGNDEQTRYAMYLFFKKKDFTFIHQHINEDIEIHQTTGVILIQVKRNQKTAGDIAQYIEKYSKNVEFVNFICSNEDNLSQWVWVTNGNAKIKKKDVFDKIKPSSVVKDGKVILTQQKVEKFLNIMYKKFKFVSVQWIDNIQEANNKINSEIKVSYLRSKSIKDKYRNKLRDVFSEQLEILLNKRTKKEVYNTFDELRALFVGYSYDELMGIIRNKKNKNKINSQNFRKLTMKYGPLKTKMIIKDFDKGYAIKLAQRADVTPKQLKVIKEEYDNK